MNQGSREKEDHKLWVYVLIYKYVEERKKKEEEE